MKAFAYTALPARVIFGEGTSISQISSEVEHLNCSRAFVLTTSYQTREGDAVAQALGKLCVGSYNKATMHTPIEITHEALALVEAAQADCIVAVGGGSTTGLGKALAYASQGKLKQIVIPTTYAGSEATPILGQTEKGIKTTLKSTDVLPQTIIYDVNLTLTLPLGMSVTSGINAIAHAIEALYAPEANPVIDLLACDGIAKLATGMSMVHANPSDREGRAQMLYGAWACGTCLGSVGMGLHHKLCHTLGGTFNLSHSETHTVVLPHAIAYNASYAPEAMSKAAAVLGTKDVARAIFDLSKSHGGPTSLKELGFKAEDIERAADLATSKAYPNPAPLDRSKLVTLLTNAYHGHPPQQ